MQISTLKENAFLFGKRSQTGVWTNAVFHNRLSKDCHLWRKYTKLLALIKNRAMQVTFTDVIIKVSEIFKKINNGDSVFLYIWRK